LSQKVLKKDGDIYKKIQAFLKKEFLNIISLIINSTYFKFDNKFFKSLICPWDFSIIINLSEFSNSRFERYNFFPTLISTFQFTELIGG